MKLFLLTAIICVSTALCFGAGSWYYEDYSILIEPAEMPLSGKIYGYEDISLKLYNKSAQAHTVEFKLSSHKISSQLQSISKTITLGAGKNTVVTLSKPYLVMHNVDVKVWIDRIPQETFSLKSYNTDSEYKWSIPISILLSEKLSYNFFDNLLNSKKISTYKENKLNIYRNEALPEGKNAYSGFDCVILKSSQILDCSQKAKDTLYRYVRSGGGLFIAGDFKPDIKTINSFHGNNINFYEYGFGLIVIGDIESAKGIENLDWKKISEKLWKNGTFAFRHIRPGSNINDWMRVVEVSPVPVKIMVMVIALMVIIIGPVNILILKFANKSLWMFVTVPLISIIGVVIILIFSIKNEGTGNTEKITSFTVIDQRSGFASTGAVLGYYCPVLPIGELQFEDNTQVIPLNLPEFGSNGNKHINLDNGQRLYGSWINSRVPSYFAAIKLTDDSLPIIEFTNNKNGSIEVTNKTTETVSVLRYKDKVARVWETKNLKPGQRSYLEPAMTNESSMSLCPIRKMISNDWIRSGESVYKNPYQNLYPGCYVAHFDGEIFLEKPASDKVSKTTQTTFVYGITEGVK